MSVSTDTYKQLLSKFASGVTIVTARNGEDVHGLTVSAFCAVSLEPPLVLICIDKQTSSHAVLSESGSFVVNILNENQGDLAFRFANPKLDSAARFADTEYRLSESGIPILADIVAYVECNKFQSLDAGDHTIFLGSVVGGNYFDEQKPMIYFRSAFHKI